MDINSGLSLSVSEREDCGAFLADKMLGFQKMPEGYALMLNSDKSHFYWVRYDGIESSIHWDMWAVYRGAKIDSVRIQP